MYVLILWTMYNMTVHTPKPNNSLFQQCLEMLQREDVKNDLKLLLNPILEFVLFEIRPYAYIILLFLILIVITSVANLILLIFYRNRIFCVSQGNNLH